MVHDLHCWMARSIQWSWKHLSSDCSAGKLPQINHWNWSELKKNCITHGSGISQKARTYAPTVAGWWSVLLTKRLFQSSEWGLDSQSGWLTVQVLLDLTYTVRQTHNELSNAMYIRESLKCRTHKKDEAQKAQISKETIPPALLRPGQLLFRWNLQGFFLPAAM